MFRQLNDVVDPSTFRYSSSFWKNSSFWSTFDFNCVRYCCAVPWRLFGWHVVIKLLLLLLVVVVVVVGEHDDDDDDDNGVDGFVSSLLSLHRII